MIHWYNILGRLRYKPRFLPIRLGYIRNVWSSRRRERWLRQSQMMWQPWLQMLKREGGFGMKIRQVWHGKRYPPLKFNMESAPGKGDSLIFLMEFIIFRFHVKLQGGSCFQRSIRISWYTWWFRDRFNRQGLGDMKAQIVGVNYSGVTWSHPKWWFTRGILAMTQHADLWRWARYDSKVTQIISYITHDSIPVLCGHIQFAIH